jgi:putative SOS response-associated peptidase YedK
MKRMHKPDDEKRSLVILPRELYGDWLACREPELARTMLAPYPAELMCAEPVQRMTGANGEERGNG